MRYVDAAAVAALGPAGAVRAITEVLAGGLDPRADPPRGVVGLESGQFLLMPSQSPTAAGVKVVTVAPDNPSWGLPRIQATYLLHDRDTLALRAVLDGTALTALRTPAVSVAAVLRRLPRCGLRVAVVGAGPQAVGHIAALEAVRTVDAATYLVRDPRRATVPATGLDTPAARDALSSAHVVICATSSRTPLFDSRVLRSDVVVIAVGSHEPDSRELDGDLMGRAHVVVEDVSTALREAGDVVLAVGEGRLDPATLIAMGDVVTGAVAPPPDSPVVFKSVGMAWEDLVVAEAVVRHAD